MAQRDTPDDAQDKPEGLEYENFEELARKLLTVSKKDLDEARAREDAEKA